MYQADELLSMIRGMFLSERNIKNCADQVIRVYSPVRGVPQQAYPIRMLKIHGIFVMGRDFY